MKKLAGILFVFSATVPQVLFAQDLACTNLGNNIYKKEVEFKAPDENRTIGAKISLQGGFSDIPDTKAECLPLSLRYNNPGAVQTRAAGYWPQQIGKDSKGHAIFANVEDGVAAWVLWMFTRTKENPNISARRMMSIYAPSNDCIGTVAKLKNGKCPPGFPLNPTRIYAVRVAKALDKDVDEPMLLKWNDCLEQRAGLFSTFRVIMTFEAGGNFCGQGGCSVDQKIFERAVDRIAGPIDWSQCGPEARERYLQDN